MAGRVKSVNLSSRTARDDLKRRSQPYWMPIDELLPARVHLGYLRQKGEHAGRWIERRYTPEAKYPYRIATLGYADDAKDSADGVNHLSYEQVRMKIKERLAKRTENESGADSPPAEQFTVAVAMRRYIAHKEREGAPVRDLKSRTNAHILPTLGDRVVAKLTAEDIQTWLATLAAAPKQRRPKLNKDGKKIPNYAPDKPATRDEIRKRKASANRTLTYLKAALNLAFDQKKVTSDNEWGRRVKPFKGADAARIQYLTTDEAARLINSCDPEFRPLVHAALETGCRYGELTRLQVQDFNARNGTIFVQESKTDKSRHVVLSEDGIALFRQLCAGRPRDQLIFRHDDGSEWKASEQERPMEAARTRAKLAITFHGLRHVWATLAIENGVSLQTVQRNLGHTSLRQVIKHYLHWQQNAMREEINKAGPRYGVQINKTVVPIH